MGRHVDMHGHAYIVFSKAIKGVCGAMLKKDYWGNNFVSIVLCKGKEGNLKGVYKFLSTLHLYGSFFH